VVKQKDAVLGTDGEQAKTSVRRRSDQREAEKLGARVQDRERLEASAGIGGHRRGEAARDRSGEARWQGRRRAGARGDVVWWLACTEVAARKRERKNTVAAVERSRG
jgi:hypothetical protein